MKMDTKVQFHKNAAVLTAGGDEVGSLERVVFSPESKMVTHIVVRTGGPLNKTYKVVPIDVVTRTAENKIILRDEAGDLESFPAFEEERIVDKKTGLDHPPLYDSTTPELLGYPEPNIPVMPVPGDEYVTQSKQNIPTGTVALKEGAKVITSEGQHVGRVERVLTNPEMDQVTHLLISKGMFPRETKLIPIEWVSTMTEDEVYLQVDEHRVEELSDFSITS
jgi:uncharacterized protein YrrD